MTVFSMPPLPAISILEPSVRATVSAPPRKGSNADGEEKRSMRKIRKGGVVIALFLAVGVGLQPVQPEASFAQTQGRPNIVFIAADDMRKDDLRWMPKTREFIKSRGMTFENAYVTDPICCPSRATFLAGQYPHNHGILNNIPPSGGFDKVYRSGFEDRTIAKKLKGSGYRTALFGKYFNGYCRKDGNCTDPTYVPPGWSEWYAWSGGATLNVNGQFEEV